MRVEHFNYQWFQKKMGIFRRKTITGSANNLHRVVDMYVDAVLVNLDFLFVMASFAILGSLNYKDGIKFGFKLFIEHGTL